MSQLVGDPAFVDLRLRDTRNLQCTLTLDMTTSTECRMTFTEVESLGGSNNCASTVLGMDHILHRD